MRTTTTIVVFGILPFTAAATAQSPELATGVELDPASATAGVELPRELLVPIHTAADDPAGGPYGIWAAGTAYKASFHDGMSFVPMLGRNGQSHALSWHTTSVRVGERELLTADEPVGHRASEVRYEFDLGGVVEAYDVRTDGLEQTFVIARRPNASGDLVIEATVTGTLTSSEQPLRHAELTFRDADGTAIVGYGAATAIDAAGRSFAMTTGYHDQRIELRLPSAALAEASYPLVVDPLLSNLTLAVTDDIDSLDAFRDHQPTQDHLWICYSRFASATDRDVVVARFAEDYSSGGTTVFADLSANWSSTEPQITGNGNVNNGRSITVFTREFSATSRRVRWHLHDKASTAFEATVSSMPFSGAEQWRPDVGGSYAGNFGETALIVFQREGSLGLTNSANSQVYGLELNLQTNQHYGTFAIADLGGDVDQERPNVNQIGDGTHGFSWVVAWQEYDNTTNGPWRIGARRIGSEQDPSGDTMYLPTGTAHAIRPVVSGTRSNYLIVYGKRPNLSDKPLEAPCRALHAQRLDWRTFDTTGTLPAPERQIRAVATDALVAGACSHDWDSLSQWSATYLDRVNQQLRVAKIGYDGLPVEDLRIYQAAGWQPTQAASSFEFDGRRHAIVFASRSASSAGPLLGTHLTYDAIAAPTEYGTQCGVSATLSHDGSQRIGSPRECFELRIALPNTLTLFAASLGQASLPLDPLGMTGCELAIDGGSQLLATLVHVTTGTGRADQDLPVPSTLAPFELYTQWFVLIPGVNSAGMAVTRGLRTPFGR